VGPTCVTPTITWRGSPICSCWRLASTAKCNAHKGPMWVTPTITWLASGAMITVEGDLQCGHACLGTKSFAHVTMAVFGPGWASCVVMLVYARSPARSGDVHLSGASLVGTCRVTSPLPYPFFIFFSVFLDVWLLFPTFFGSLVRLVGACGCWRFEKSMAPLFLIVHIFFSG
jgi:hypothetical protein